MDQRIFQRLEISAPEPVIVVEVGIALGTRCTRAVALHAMDLVGGTSAFDRLLQQFRATVELANVC